MDAYSLYKDLNANYDGYRSKHLAGMAFNTQGDERQGHLAELAKYNPVVAQSMKKDLDESDKQGFIDGAKLLNSFRNNPEMANQAYQRLKPKLSALGVQMPDQLDDTVWQAVDQINSAYDVNNQKRVQSTQILQDGTIAYMDNNGNLVRTSEKARENYGAPIQTAGGFVSPNKNAPFATPLTAPNASTGGGRQVVMNAPVNESDDVIANAEIQRRLEAGQPVNFKVVNGQIVDIPVNGGQYQAPVKQEAPKSENAPAGYRFDAKGNLSPISGGPADPANKPAAGQSLDARKTAEQRKALKQDALNFAASWLGKTPEDVAKMTPQKIREEIASGGRLTTGPIMGSIWGMNKIANSDLEAYKSSAAAKQARINNPTGPVTEGDFRAAEKSIFSPDKPAGVNANLVYQALTAGDQPTQATQTKVVVPKVGEIVKGYRFKGGNPADPNSWIKAQ